MNLQDKQRGLHRKTEDYTSVCCLCSALAVMASQKFSVKLPQSKVTLEGKPLQSPKPGNRRVSVGQQLQKLGHQTERPRHLTNEMLPSKRHWRSRPWQRMNTEMELSSEISEKDCCVPQDASLIRSLPLRPQSHSWKPHWPPEPGDIDGSPGSSHNMRVSIGTWIPFWVTLIITVPWDQHNQFPGLHSQVIKKCALGGSHKHWGISYVYTFSSRRYRYSGERQRESALRWHPPVSVPRVFHQAQRCVC